MPYPNEHACRLHDPGSYREFARVSRRSASKGKTYSVIRGKKPDGSWEDQAFRYPKDRWAASEARSHCNSHDGKFEPASNNRRDHEMILHRNIATLSTDLPIREEMFDGKRYLVVPVVALVEGVHCGSHGCLFYPAEEIAKYAESWNGRPLPVFHPTEQGYNLSANDPKLLEERSVGQLFNVFFDPDGNKLKGEFWINIDKASKISPAVLSIIQSGRELEVSTALWSDDDEIPGTWNGEEYQSTVRNFRPDHVALLPGGGGACSWQDGCGVRANQPQKGEFDMNLEDNIRSTARTPSFDGTETTSWAEVPKTFATYRDAYYASHGGKPDDVASRVQDAPTAMKNWIASKTLLGDGNADNERDLMMFPVVNPKTGKLNEGALRAVISGRGSQAQIPAQAKASAQNKARSLLNKHFGAELEASEAEGVKEKIRSFVKSVGNFFGLKIQETSHEELRSKIQKQLDALDNPGWLHFVKEIFDDFVIYEARGDNPSETGMTGGVTKLYRRGYTIDESGEVKLKNDAKEVREERKYVAINADPDGSEEKDKEVVAMKQNEEKIAELVKDLVACDKNSFTGEDEEWLKSLSVEQLGKMKLVEKTDDKDDETKANEKKEPEKGKEVKTEEKEKGKEVKENEKEKVEDFIKKAPVELQGTLNRAVNRDRQIKAELVKALLANDRNKFTEEQLNAKEIGELENLAELARVEVDYSLAPGGPGSLEKDDVPEMPKTFEKV